MSGIDSLVDRVRADVAADLRARLRRQLLTQPREWLVEQVVDDVVRRMGLEPAPGADWLPGLAQRMRPVDIDAGRLAQLVGRFQGLDRDRLETFGYLVGPPPKGGPLIDSTYRTATGDDLLGEAKDLLYALLFGDASHGVRLTRVHRELLTLTVPVAKAHAFSFLSCVATEFATELVPSAPPGYAAGQTWHDRRGADDPLAANILVQVEYGEVASELVGSGIVAALRVINDLEVNETILYARIETAERGPLAPPAADPIGIGCVSELGSSMDTARS